MSYSIAQFDTQHHYTVLYIITCTLPPPLQLLGSGFQQWTFPLLWSQLPTATAHSDCAQQFLLQLTVNCTLLHVYCHLHCSCLVVASNSGHFHSSGPSFQQHQLTAVLTATHSEVKSLVTTDSQSSSLSWCQAPILRR
jgi:hypothetical protein